MLCELQKKKAFMIYPGGGFCGASLMGLENTCTKILINIVTFRNGSTFLIQKKTIVEFLIRVFFDDIQYTVLNGVDIIIIGHTRI